LLTVAALSDTSRADRPDFDAEVAPVLAAHCLECHGRSEPEGKLDLSQKSTAFRGGESGPAIIPESLAESLLWQRIDAGEMPPKGKLSAAEQATIKQWIVSGASWGTDTIDRFRYSTAKRAGYDWWSLRPLHAGTPPAIADDSWSQNEIDRFTLAKLNQAGLEPAPRADPRTLVRRVYFDLIGLPPPLDVVERFRRNPAPAAWDDLVNSLLDSQHYGERWAQHWLDVARFGETDGYEYNVPREHAWHYRDWVIRSLNNDLPYDEFVRMQIAGDVLKPNSVEGAAAVGFLVAGVHNTVLGKSEAMKRASRHEELEEMVGTTFQAFLGLTVNCARCHDHKFDPISNEEYYQLIAALDGVTHGTRNVGQNLEPSKVAELEQREAERTARLTELVSKRGGKLSQSANAIQSTVAVDANTRGEEYTLSLKAAPTVWGIKSQATTASDGILVRIIRSDGSTLAEKFFKPGSWTEAGNKQRFTSFEFSYAGDGTGAVKLWIGSNPATGRFGGAIDDVLLQDRSGRVLLEETFDEFQQQTNKGVQADTRRTVFWGLQSKSWERFGINSLHAVEYEPGNLAAQIFSGWQDVEIRGGTKEEQDIVAELKDISGRLTSQPVYSVVSRNPGVMRILHRGDAKSLGPAVAPGGLRAIGGVSREFGLAKDSDDAARRRKLADWITHPDNGPFHRVIVNRIWHHHFGRGIVETPNDLGFNGGRPSHHELLDWLAGWFRDHGYSLKQLHRLVATSATYQQRSTIADHPSSDRAQQIDSSNRLLWRQNPRRVDAETLRDSLLVMAGTLNRTQFGPGYRDVRIERVGSAHYYRAIDPTGAQFNRRTVYRWHARGERSSLLETFDCPDPSATTPSRNITTTPTQALSHWNNSFIVRTSKRMAEQIEQELGTDDATDKVIRAWHRVLARDPDDEELAFAVDLVEQHGLTLLCRVLFNCSEAIVID
jgi:hypothetical protein